MEFLQRAQQRSRTTSKYNENLEERDENRNDWLKEEQKRDIFLGGGSERHGPILAKISHKVQEVNVGEGSWRGTVRSGEAVEHGVGQNLTQSVDN